MTVLDVKLRNAKPTDKVYRITVGDNLYLEIMPSGKKVWRMRYRQSGSKSESIYTIGNYPLVTQVTARTEAQQAKQLISEGINPTQYRKEQRKAAQAKRDSDTLTFEKIARQWHEERLNAGKWKESHAAKIIKSLENDVFPMIGNLPIIQIDAPLLLKVLQPIVERGVIETSRKINQRVSAIFRFAIVRNIIKVNPADHIRDELPSVEINHNPHLTPEQIPDFLNAINNSQARETVKLAILLTMHTLTRTSETRFAQWSEFDLDNRVWNIPAERMKMGKAHTIPLSDQAMEIMERLKEITKGGGYLFTTTNRHKPMSENAMLNVLYKAGYKGIITIHGLRGTGSTILNEQQFRYDVIESALAHIDPNKIRGAYNHAQYFEERKIMMQSYSDYLESLHNGAQIIPIAQKQA